MATDTGIKSLITSATHLPRKLLSITSQLTSKTTAAEQDVTSAGKRKAEENLEKNSNEAKRAKLDGGAADETSDVKKAMELLSFFSPNNKGDTTIDEECPLFKKKFAKVSKEYDCMLSLTDIGSNRNAYYKLQVIVNMGRYYTWKRWGRVGSRKYQTELRPFERSAEDAEADFREAFQIMTGNDWAEKDQFIPKQGKFLLLETTNEPINERRLSVYKNPVTTLPCKLTKETQYLIELIFDNNMFADALKSMDIDTKKLPLAQLSKQQIARGFQVLEQIEKVLNKKENGDLRELSSRFYSLIPHNSGTRSPSIISSAQQLRNKVDKLLDLVHIEWAMDAQKDEMKSDKHDKREKIPGIPHPLDVKYDLLQCDLQLLDKTSEHFKIIYKYFHATKPRENTKILDVWSVNRHSEAERFEAHKDTGNRKLLWHGTKVTSIVSILKNGLLNIPPGLTNVTAPRGIYFASERRLSSYFVGRTTDNIGLMFLSEVVLGDEFVINGERERPNKYVRKVLTDQPRKLTIDSWVAQGRTEPDPKQNAEIELEGKKVIVPLGNAVAQPSFENSAFLQSEYIIYDDSQCRLRYLVMVKYGSDGWGGFFQSLFG